jgi:hypothetical protein
VVYQRSAQGLEWDQKERQFYYLSIVFGEYENLYEKIPPTELDDRQKRSLLATPEYQEIVTESPFLYLTCDLPPPPLFIDEFRENIIPQVEILFN